MPSISELKQIFQDGWNIPERVDNYSRRVDEFVEGPTHVAWRNTLAAALATDRPLHILDVGTGPGIYACLYAQMGHRATGLDFSETMLRLARRRSAELDLPCQFVFGDAEEPPFGEASFDVVSSRHVLFTLPRPGVAVREWVRILKPGGRMILMGHDHDEHVPESYDRQRSEQGNHGDRDGDVANKNRGGWSPPPNYREALSHCPLFRHGSRTLLAVMQAAGLDDIHLQPTDEIEAARQQNAEGSDRRGFGDRHFVLVGVKPRQ